MRRLVGALTVVTVALTATPALAQQQWSPFRVDSHAPIGVMGDHLHETGEMMLSLRFMRMSMEGNRDGTDRLTAQEVLNGFPVAPLRMPTSMWMLGVMYAPTDRVTLMGTLPIRNLSMDHLTRTDVEFTTEAAGLGDISLSALVGLYDENRQRVHLNAGLRLPTGSIKRTGATPAGADSPLPYPMQLGSGTWDLEPGVTYLGQGDDWSWGAQMHGTFRLGENARNYALGQRIEATAWGARVVSDTASLSARLALSRIGNIDGADEVLDPAMVPTADPIRRAGRRFDLAFGINIYAHGGAVDGHRLAIEVVWPLYQSLDGPQLETDWAITIGWQKAWAVAR